MLSCASQPREHGGQRPRRRRDSEDMHAAKAGHFGGQALQDVSVNIRAVDGCGNPIKPPSPPLTPVDDGPSSAAASAAASQTMPELHLSTGVELGLPPATAAPTRPEPSKRAPAECPPQADVARSPRWPKRRGSTAAISHRRPTADIACIGAALATQYKRVAERNAVQRKRVEAAEQAERRAAQARRRATREAAAAKTSAAMREEERLFLEQLAHRRAEAQQQQQQPSTV